MNLMKGAHYRSEFLYNALALLKLGSGYRLRYQIAAHSIKPGEFVVDVCSGPGQLKDFIPKSCGYLAMDASPEFLSSLKKKGASSILQDLHKGWPPSVPVADVIVMVISLCQFRDTSADRLLESFKTAGKRVVIVEDVLSRARGKSSWLQRAMNYLCATDFYVPVTSWYTHSEFEQLMQHHGYQCQKISGRYMMGLYGLNSDPNRV